MGRDYEGVETSVVLSSTALETDTFPSGVSGLGVSVPVLGDPALRLRGLSAFPAGDVASDSEILTVDVYSCSC